MRMTEQQYAEMMMNRALASAPKPEQVAAVIGKLTETRTSKQRMQSLGRLGAGRMNKTESRYADYLEMRRRSGEIVWFRFEGMKLRLADNTFYTADFAVKTADGALEFHEVKGFMTDDGAVKLKVAAEQYPFRFLLVRSQLAKHGGGWDIREIG